MSGFNSRSPVVKLPAKLRRHLRTLAAGLAHNASAADIQAHLQALRQEFLRAWEKGQVTVAQERCLALRLRELLAPITPQL